ncbi:MAG: TetR/AcrR family transcriptional regulator [Candidatus Protochlamydia sp.]|nr:TetR/AcrR family transcriptional regulator [Candidatus Protochlamydia sp.]
METDMGIQERKEREKEAFRKLIIATAHELVSKHGLEGLTMRALAQTIEYSQSKIYEFFKNKDQLCEVLCEELCEKLMAIVKQISNELEPDKYLTELILKVVEFHATYPHSEELFTLVCFGPKRFKVPQAYLDMEVYPIAAVKNLKSPYIKTDEEVLIALDIIRCFKIGIATLMASETSLESKKRVYTMAENIVKVLIRGWHH